MNEIIKKVLIHPYSVINHIETTYSNILNNGIEEFALVQMKKEDGGELLIMLPDYKVLEEIDFNYEEKSYAMNYVIRHGILIWDLAREGGFDAQV